MASTPLKSDIYRSQDESINVQIRPNPNYEVLAEIFQSLTTLEPTFEVFAQFTKPNWDPADGGIVYKLETPNFR